VFTDLPSWLLTQTAQHAYRLVSEQLGAAGARGYHYRTLTVLDREGPASQADLGRRGGIHLSDLVATLNELVAGGFVERTPDPVDRRRNVITLTPAGRRHLRRLDRQVARAQDELLAPLDGAERATLTVLLHRLLEHHGGQQTEPRMG
jgi:DNA-binding MarR family transcriptional regulator